MGEAKKSDILWLRLKLPKQSIISPTLFIASIFDGYQIFLEHQLIYEFGHPFRKDSAFSFSGHEYILVPMPENYSGKYIYIRLYSSYKSMGYQSIWFGSADIHTRKILKKDIGRLSAAFILFAFSLFCLLFLIRLRGKKAQALFGFSVLLFSCAVYPLVDSRTHYLIYNNGIFWMFMSQFTSLIPVSLVYFYEKVFGAGWKKIIRRLWQVHLVTS